MSILVVEDTEDSRLYLVDQLKIEGYEVESAENGREALEKAIESQPELIISDILMPEMDGFELCRHIKKNDALKQIPFIFYTATYTDPRDEQLALSLGADRFIVKPTRPADLIKIIHDTIEESRKTTGHPINSDNGHIEKLYSATLFRKLEKKLPNYRIKKNNCK